MMNKKNWLPLLCACLGHILWGFSYLFTKTALNIAAPNILLSFRFLCLRRPSAVPAWQG